MSQSNSNDGTSKGDEYLLNLFLTDEGIAVSYTHLTLPTKA